MVASVEIRAALVLRSLPGVGAVRYRDLIERFGRASMALAASDRDFAASASVDSARARRDGRYSRRADALLARCREAGILAVSLGEPGYPTGLSDLSDPPPVLFARGRMEILEKSCAAVVGSRRATGYGRRTARRIGAFLAAQGRPVVSGMAMGIDAEAHWGALPGLTVAVLGSGVDVPAPKQNTSLYREILKEGLILSAFDPGTAAEPHHFPARNRIIAALADDIIVVEAAAKSGALLTAGFGLDLGREVHAVPGPIDRPTSAGTNRLISDGASLITGLDSISALSPGQLLPRDPELRDFFEHVPESPATIDEVALRAAVSVSAASVFLTRLQLQGLISNTSDGMVLRTPGGRLRDAEP